MGAKEDALKAAVLDSLDKERNGIRISSIVMEMVAKYLVDVAHMQDVNEFDVKDLLSIAKEAWEDAYDGAPLPGLHARNIANWLKGSAASSAKKIIDLSSRMSLKSGEDEEEDENDEALFGDAGPTSRTARTLAEDKDAQGLSGTRIVCLSMALELGRVPAQSEVIGKCTYGSDPRLSDLAKQQRKAGVTTLSKVLESTSVRRDMTTFVGGLVRDFSERRMIEEASLITQWWAETQTVSSDDKILAEYVKEWLRKFPGRGIPSVIDVVIATRVTGSRGGQGVSSEEIKSLKDALKASKEAMASMKAELKSEMANLRSQVNNRSGGDQPSGAGPICRICGERGHIARNCPNKDKKKDPPAEKEEEEGK